MSPADSPFAQLPAPGPHPATAELRAYAAGTLAPTEEHRIEAHTLDCERCAELVEGFSMSDGPTTDRAIAELRTRLQARLGQAEPEPAAGGWAWPRLAAAAALLAVVGTGIWGWEKYESAAPPATARQEAPSAPAAPPAAPATRSAAPIAAAPQAPAPASPAPADYAAVQRPAKPRASRQPAPSTLGGTDWLANSASRLPASPPHRPAARPAAPSAAPAADMVVASETAAPVGISQANQATAGADDNSQESKLARADLAPAAKSESVLTQPAADSVRSLSEVAVTTAAPLRKAKAKLAEPAPAMVLNTPMPAGFAIKPAPVGGTPAFRDYLRREAAQFEPEKENRISGLVHVQFTVGADGQLSNLKVTRGLRADYDAEALRLVCEGPKWQPGIAGGRRAPLTVDFTIPF